MITDIKAVNILDWVVEDGAGIWKCAQYKIMFLKDGQWTEVRVEHEVRNNKPEEETK